MGQVSGERGFKLIELLAVVFVVVLLAGMLMPRFPREKAKAGRIKCVSNLKLVGLSFRISSTDSSDWFPQQRMMSNGVALEELDVVRVFGALSNELSETKLLVCPDDKRRSASASFTNLTAENISYFVSLSAAETRPQVFLAGDRNIETNGVAVAGLFGLTTNAAVGWSNEMHVEEGNVLMGDGSVMQMSSARLRQAMREQDVETNWLVFP